MDGGTDPLDQLRRSRASTSSRLSCTFAFSTNHRPWRRPGRAYRPGCHHGGVTVPRRRGVGDLRRGTGSLRSEPAFVLGHGRGHLDVGQCHHDGGAARGLRRHGLGDPGGCAVASSPTCSSASSPGPWRIEPAVASSSSVATWPRAAGGDSPLARLRGAAVAQVYVVGLLSATAFVFSDAAVFGAVPALVGPEPSRPPTASCTPRHRRPGGPGPSWATCWWLDRSGQRRVDRHRPAPDHGRLPMTIKSTSRTTPASAGETGRDPGTGGPGAALRGSR